ncbi:regulatory LuxR family protein [Actinocorallia herbida]|uniref:Regulatory LuxR family protein n=1 Tax=Actinocorallia herbida TaxID=58109 RepID=A0A3N1D2J7_9ACTN|nr:LuxR family transcriptional regulator [Actinocorallia herbida]ROO87757.1 regulatory LuxR family protein [Actinocorallia herbida]
MRRLEEAHVGDRREDGFPPWPYERLVPGLRGRWSEGETLDRLVAGARAGRSGVLVLRGEAGVGKTALLDRLCGRAAGFQVARSAGVAAETELEFAGLHRLCAPFLDHLPRLPGAQADALKSALGLRGGDAPNRLVVGLAVLALLSEVARERPLVCVVDDVQWVDPASKQVLAIAARRLAAEPVVMVFTLREPDEADLATLPELVIRGVEPGDAQALLEWAQPGPMDARVRDRLLAETHGNPRALLELPRGMAVGEFAGGFGSARWPVGPADVEADLRSRIETLPGRTRALLWVAAAEPLADPVLLWRAAGLLGIEPAAAEPARAEGLLRIGAQVVFPSPLVRSVAYRSAPAAELRAAHLALAEASGRDADSVRYAWHLAAAAAAPDEQVAEELERAAGQAQARGGLAAAASYLRRAAMLSTEPVRRAARAIAAAEAGLQAGAFDAALGLLATADTGQLDDLQRARVTVLRARALLEKGHVRDAAPRLLLAAQTLEPLDSRLAREAYLEAWAAAAGSPAAGAALAEISRRALAVRADEGSRGPVDLLLEGLALPFTHGRSAAAPLLRRAAAGFAGSGVTDEEARRWGAQASAAALMVWDHEAALAIMRCRVGLARESGALPALAGGLDSLAGALCLAGDLRAADAPAAEADKVAQVTGSRAALGGGRLLLAAQRGRETEARTLIEVTLSEAAEDGQSAVVQRAQWATAILCNGLGLYEEALTAARQACEETPELYVADLAAIELVEAAAKTDRPEAAQAAFDRLAERTAVAGTDWGLGVRARLRALLSDGEAADELYREAIELLSRTRMRSELARAHLVYGEWLRGGGRRTLARRHLRSAYTMFGECGMEAFAARARGELAATGERVRPRADALSDLSPQEAEIVRFAVAGRSNREIGARLFLSPRTVEWHLRKVFMKLGVGSRHELAGALDGTGRTTIPA